VSLIEKIDVAIEQRGVRSRAGGSTARGLVETRLSASRALMGWLNRVGMTPRARAEVLGMLGVGGLPAEIAHRRRELGASADVE
jgi:hypothetical protein